MKLFALGTVMLIVVTALSVDAIGLRVSVGGEVIPLTYSDLKNHNTGSGLGMRADIVWGAFGATTFEVGYRRWERETPVGSSQLEFHRIGLLQRFYPLYSLRLRVAPYLGFGFTATNRDRFSLDVPDADLAGITILTGCEVPTCLKGVRADPYIRWEHDRETDWTYSYVSVGLNLIWEFR